MMDKVISRHSMSMYPQHQLCAGDNLPPPQQVPSSLPPPVNPHIFAEPEDTTGQAKVRNQSPSLLPALPVQVLLVCPVQALLDCALLVLLAYPHQRLQDHAPQHGGTSETDRRERKESSGRPILVECVESP